MRNKPPKQTRWQRYEKLKARIAATAKTPDEYQRRIVALAKRMRV